tara:strand:- start:290 stop:1246 length:957 start_codon:yes stop_codon:yes gene_type:complete
VDDLSRRLRSVNLNLLPVLRALLHHKSVSQAANELNMTQSNVSMNLAQLRIQFDDELLIRVGRHFQLTERARLLREPLEKAVTAVGSVVIREDFDPAESNAQFKIATADYVTAIVSPLAAARLSCDAPKAQIQFSTAHARSGLALLAGEIDLLLGPRQVLEAIAFQSSALSKELVIETMCSEPMVCVVAGKTEIPEGGYTVDEYLKLPHASFHLDLISHASLEQAYLIEKNYEQFNRVLSSDFLVLPMISANSDCVSLVPSSIARQANRYLDIQTFEGPLDIPQMELSAMWQKRYRSNQMHAWFRQVVQECMKEGISV